MENKKINYEIDKIIEKLERTIKDETAKRDAWQAVKIVTKKDGQPFSTFSKNFQGARVETPYYSLGGGKELIISTWSPASGYISDSFALYDTLNKYTHNDKAAAKPQNIQQNGPGICDYYIYDVDDTRDAINNRIDYYTRAISENEKALQAARDTLNKFFNTYYEALKELKETAAPLYYDARNAASNIYI